MAAAQWIRMTDPDQSEQEPKVETKLQVAFARALNEELDRVGYPAPPARANALSQDLGVGRMQAYRIARGDNLPTLKSMLKLQSLGVSLDAVLERLQDTQPAIVTVDIAGVTVQATASPASGRMPFVMAKQDSRWVLRPAEASHPIQGDELPVGGLRFTKPRPVIAVIEDDPATLQVFCADLAPAFNAVPFPSEKAFIKALEENAAFDAVLLDWVLPDIDGKTVLEQIRAHTHAFILITTGHREVSPAIGGVLGSVADVSYIGKPTEADILRAMLASGIEKVAGSAK